VPTAPVMPETESQVAITDDIRRIADLRYNGVVARYRGAAGAAQAARYVYLGHHAQGVKLIHNAASFFRHRTKHNALS